MPSMISTKKKLPFSPNYSIKTRFTYRFLRALNKLNNQNQRPSPSSITERYIRYHKVKNAAYGSMASAVGSRRIWSRSLLSQTRNRGMFRRSHRSVLRRRSEEENPREGFGYGEASKLREIVPGGEVMDFCSLLDETADYIKCLAMQVKIMKDIVNVC